MNLPSIPTAVWHDTSIPMAIYVAVQELKPNLCVELGCCEGYTSYFIASALQENGKGTLDAYDLWQDSELFNFYKAKKINCINNLVGLPVEIGEQDANEVYKNYPDDTVDFLVVDIGNDGQIFKSMLLNWHRKLTSKAIVVLEGGCEERDKVEWMKDKPPIKPMLEDKELLSLYNMSNTGVFPSITIAERIL